MAKDDNDAIRMEFARRLKKGLAELGWTQTELARRMGVGRDNISKYCAGKVLPLLPARRAMAEAMGAKETDLFPGSLSGSIPIKQFDLGDGTTRLRMDVVVPTNRVAKVINSVYSTMAEPEAT